MPTQHKPPPIIARNSQEGTNTLLEQWHEALAERVLALESRFEGLESSSAENTKLLRQVLIAVRGQREPGLETPGLNDRLHQMEEAGKVRDSRIDELEDRAQALEEFKFRTLVLVGVVTSGLGLVAAAAQNYQYAASRFGSI